MEKLINKKSKFKYENALKAYQALEKSISTLKETALYIGAHARIVAGGVRKRPVLRY